MRPAVLVLSSVFAVASAGLLALPMTGVVSPAMAAGPRSSPAPTPAQGKTKKQAKPAATPRPKASATGAAGSGSVVKASAAAGQGSASNDNLLSPATAEPGASDAPDGQAVTSPTDGDAPGSGSDPSGTTSGPPGGGGPTSPGGSGRTAAKGSGKAGSGGQPAASASSDEGGAVIAAEGEGQGGAPSMSARPGGTGLLDPGGPVISAVSRVPSFGIFLASLLAASTGGLWMLFSLHRRRRPGSLVAAANGDVPPPFTVMSGANPGSSSDPLVASLYRSPEDGAEGIEAETGPERDRTLPRTQPAWLERLDAARDEAAGR